MTDFSRRSILLIGSITGSGSDEQAATTAKDANSEPRPNVARSTTDETLLNVIPIGLPQALGLDSQHSNEAGDAFGFQLREIVGDIR